MIQWARVSALLFCIGLLFLGPQPRAYWQSRDSNYNIVVSSGGFTPSCTASTNFLARATNVTLTADKTNYDTLLCGPLNSILSNGVALYLFAAPNDTTALLNLLSSSNNGTKHGTESFTSYTGFTGDGSSWYIDSGFSSGGVFTQNSASLGVCILTNTASPGGTQIGTNDVTNTTLIAQSGGTNFVAGISGGTLNSSQSSSQGFWIGTRTGATAIAIYKNGASQASGSAASTGVDDGNMLIFARNNGAGSGVAVNFSSYQMAAAIIWAGVNSTDASTISTAIHTYLTAYGVSGC